MIDWIDVKNELPKGNNIKVLTTERLYNLCFVRVRKYFSDNDNCLMDSDEWYGAGFYDNYDGQWFPVNITNDVIAWAYLPEPYEGG